MRTIRTLVVEDEPLAQDIMEMYISKLPDLELVGKCRNALEAFRFISTGTVDLLLLDINMPEINGMDFLRTLNNPPKVIFTTAYSEFALDSYELNAIDYLLKPISFERFLKAIDKAREVMNISHTGGPSAGEQNDKILFVKSEGKLVRVDLAQLWFVEGLRDYVKLWTDNGKIVIHGTMKSFEDSLASYNNFMRVHKSYIINVDFISEIDGNMLKIKDQFVAIGTTYKDNVMKLLNNYRLL